MNGKHIGFSGTGGFFRHFKDPIWVTRTKDNYQ